jgi:outer membrane phospholipase A
MTLLYSPNLLTVDITKSKTFHANLVDVIPGYSVLWRTTSNRYKDKDRKQRSWEEISVKLGVEGKNPFVVIN